MCACKTVEFARIELNRRGFGKLAKRYGCLNYDFVVTDNKRFTVVIMEVVLVSAALVAVSPFSKQGIVMIKLDGLCAVGKAHFKARKAKRSVGIVGERSLVTCYGVVGRKLKFLFNLIMAASIVLGVVALAGEPNMDTVVAKALETAAYPTFGKGENITESGFKLVFLRNGRSNVNLTGRGKSARKSGCGNCTFAFRKRGYKSVYVNRSNVGIRRCP